MLKLLRNLVLAAILLAGALKLLAWYAVGNDAERVTAAIVPFAQLKYDGLSAGLRGDVTLSNVTVIQTTTKRAFHADSVTLETPGLFWLLKHTLLHESELPPTLAMSAQGVKLPPTAWIDAQLIDPVTLVPFPAAGCGVNSFSAQEFRRLGASDGVASARASYHYGSESHTLDFTTMLSTPGYATVSLSGDVHPFDLEALAKSATWDKLHAGQIGVDYVDDGFIARRNQFCAQRLNTSAADFISRHLSAALGVLDAHHVQPSNELAQLYRNLVEHGGQASVLSLPRSTFVLSNWRNTSPDDLLRQLNITARYRDTPPVMFRLTFTAPPADESQPATDANTVVATAPAPSPPPTPVSTPAPTPTPAPPVAPPTPPVVAKAPSIVPPTPVATTNSTPSAPTTTGKKANDNLGLHDLDRAEAKLAPKQAPVKNEPAPQPATAPAATETDAQYASVPQPPPGSNSTLALVWKPTIERLPPPPPPKLDYDVIDYANLSSEQGRRVRLITDGDKRIEGYVITADATSVVLRVGRNDGDAQFEVPKKRIRQVQLFHRQ